MLGYTVQMQEAGMVGYAGNQETAVIKQWLQRVGRDWGGAESMQGFSEVLCGQ